MMKVKRNILSVLAGSLLLAGWGAGLSGCVEDEPSMSLSGSVAYEGEIDEDTNTLICDMDSAQPGSVDSYFSSADLNLAQGRELQFSAEIINLLTQSNQQTGTEETFPGLYQDQNKIRITKLSVHFPDSLNSFAGAGLAEKYLAKPDIRKAGLMDSGGGAIIMTIPLFRQRELGAVGQFYDEAIARAGLPADTEDAIIPLVAEIQVEGKTIGGKEVESNIFEFPINVCKNCELSTTRLCVPKK